METFVCDASSSWSKKSRGLQAGEYGHWSNGWFVTMIPRNLDKITFVNK